MDIPVNVGVSEKTIRRVATALSLGADPKDIEALLQKDGMPDRDIYLALVAGDTLNRLLAKDL